MEMKVFKMNDCDWVCAESEEQAKSFYKSECGFDDNEINEYFEGEESLENTMLISVDDLPIEEQKQPQEMIKQGSELFVRRSYAWVIENEKNNQTLHHCFNRILMNNTNK